ncbi:lipoate--protein ligase family protein [Candidatus Neptunichlamydia sp. REUL1]|uniref:lipoate--protein ligase family protein n=1 Tax=Candidatus Neptunichlamydia sp. REUL1 TaxID=3064277 RepID=UPI00292CD161|nr:lipoate--protein ligase family protein [Candidatus Neptunochlamydia sp. REUL1]
MSKTINLLLLQNVPINEQLQIEEALLRLTDENWCLINEGSPSSIIMGISGKPEELVNASMMKKAPIPLIKRYSGGGTVIVDDNTLFVSFIFQKEVHDFPCFPEPILRWSESFYQKALGIPNFQLRENDYVIGDYKCGGNAQYIQKHRFVHHTTFLWDFDPSNMDYLLHPKKTPKYREGRSHDQFLCRLKEFLPSKSHFISQVIKGLSAKYTVKKTLLNPLIPLLKKPHRKTTTHFFIPL